MELNNEKESYRFLKEQKRLWDEISNLEAQIEDLQNQVRKKKVQQQQLQSDACERLGFKIFSDSIEEYKGSVYCDENGKLFLITTGHGYTLNFTPVKNYGAQIIEVIFPTNDPGMGS